MIIDADNLMLLELNTIPYDEVDSSTVTKDCSIFDLWTKLIQTSDELSGNFIIFRNIEALGLTMYYFGYILICCFAMLSSLVFNYKCKFYTFLKRL